VLNGHTDVFPVGDEPWTRDPWGGEVADGRVYGRGACDMKAGTTASLFAYAYLHRIRDRLAGRLTLTAVSDEETFGPWGARYLLENHPEVRGDCCLNGEPSSPWTVRFGEKGLIWLSVTIRTRGAHGAYAHLTRSATKIGAAIVAELEAVAAMEAAPPPDVAAALATGRDEIDRAQGAGAADIVGRVTVNIGRITAGLKVNMIPGTCRLEVDVRLPVGLTREEVLPRVAAIIARHPEAEMEEMNSQPPTVCDPNGEMLRIVQRNAAALSGFEPRPIVSLGGTDARLWRMRGIPAYVYGPRPTGMGSYDEHVEIEEFLHVVRTHVLSAYDYLATG
jgi:succinyl-diaminopimelate desuccinylase